MASYTNNLKLYKADPVADGNDTFNIDTMMNDNWNKIDAAQPFRGTTAGTATALTVSGLSETDGQKAELKLHTDISDGATLNGKPILSSTGEPITEAKEGSTLLVVYNAAKASWYQIGGGGGGNKIISVEGSPTKKAYFEVGTDGILRVKEA